MSVAEKAQQVVAQFKSQGDWEARYRLLIDFGKKLAPMDEALKTEENKLKGCQSQVWLHATLSESGRVQFQADSDALIVKGLIAVLLQVYSDAAPSEILSSPPEFVKDLGFEGNLSPSRTNGLHSMLKQIRHYAVAFNFLLESKKTH